MIVAGVGAMMVFRSAFFTMRVGDQDVSVGAVSFLQVMLDAVDREVDRRRAILRADRVRRIMDGIAFEKALTALPTYSIALMQNMEDDDQKKLLDDLNKLSAFPDFDDTVKTQILGLAVMNYLGGDVLQASVDALRARINLSQVPGQPVIEAPTTGLSLDRMLDRIRSEGTAGKTPSEVLPKDSLAGPVPAGEAAPGAASQAASAGAGVGTLSGANGSEKPTTPVDEPAVAPALVPTSLPETSLDITRVLHRVREKTSAPDAPATAPEKTPIPQADSLPVETTTTVSLPVNG